MTDSNSTDPPPPPQASHFCYGCGRPLHPAAAACPNCGAPQPAPSTPPQATQAMVPVPSLTQGRNAFCRACGAPMNAAAPLCPSCGAPQQPAPWSGGGTSRNRTAAVLLAIFLGGFGAHKFYLGQTGAGILYLLFCWTFIPAIVAFIEAIIYLTMNDAEFSRRYN